MKLTYEAALVCGVTMVARDWWLGGGCQGRSSGTFWIAGGFRAEHGNPLECMQLLPVIGLESAA